MKVMGTEEFGQEESQSTGLFQESLGQASGKSSHQSCLSEGPCVLCSVTGCARCGKRTRGYMAVGPEEQPAGQSVYGASAAGDLRVRLRSHPTLLALHRRRQADHMYHLKQHSPLVLCPV